MFFYEIIDSFDKENVSYALVGGFALALHGLVRATVDVDIVISLNLKDFEKAERALNEIGLKSRLPIRAQDVFKGRQEFIKNRNMLAWSFVDYDNPLKQVDILINKELKKIKTQVVSVAGRKVKVATLQELLKMKKESARPQDLVDIQNIERKLDEEKK